MCVCICVYDSAIFSTLHKTRKLGRRLLWYIIKGFKFSDVKYKKPKPSLYKTKKPNHPWFKYNI